MKRQMCTIIQQEHIDIEPAKHVTLHVHCIDSEIQGCVLTLLLVGEKLCRVNNITLLVGEKLCRVNNIIQNDII